MSEHDRALHDIPADECYRLLASQQIGRLAVNAEHYPLVFPVNYAVDHDVIVMRMNAGTKLAAADHANVAFEVDVIYQRTGSGWSVLVRGLAEEVTDSHRAELVARTMATGVEPWAPGHWVRLIPHGISGRRIVAGHLLPTFEEGAYL